MRRLHVGLDTHHHAEEGAMLQRLRYIDVPSIVIMALAIGVPLIARLF